MNEESLVITCHYQVVNTFLPFVHTARRSYRLGDRMKIEDRTGNRSKSYHLEEGKVVTRRL